MTDNSNAFEEKTDSGQKEIKKKKSHSYLYGILSGIWISIILFALGNLIGWLVGSYRTGIRPVSFSKRSEKEVVDADTTRKMMAIEDVIEQYYLEEPDSEMLENGIYSGMIASLGDPYSAYYSVEELKEMQQDVEGIYYGIGAYVGIDSSTTLPVISGVIEDTPAQEADLFIKLTALPHREWIHPMQWS